MMVASLGTDGPAYRLKIWWAWGGGRERWWGKEAPWTTLNRLLREHGVPARQVDGLTTNIFKLAGHPMPGTYSSSSTLSDRDRSTLRGKVKGHRR